jgi:Fe-S-cluster containining protein
MKEAIIGPNCIDPQVCHGDCCSIKIDVPRILAEEYIKKEYASESDFIRSDVFSFQLRFNEATGKCFLYNKEINGCRVHDSGIKPPQCWIYPAGFHVKKGITNCKRYSGWEIIDPRKTRKAEMILNKYTYLCYLEAKRELKEIKNRINKSIIATKEGFSGDLVNDLKAMAPSRLGGLIDGWNRIRILPAEGISLQLKKLCLKYNKNCVHMPDNFLNCNSVCDKIIAKLYDFMQTNFYNMLKKEGLNGEGAYSLLKIFDFLKKSKIGY